MNYQKIHDSIIDKAKSSNRVKTRESYYESHHIIPKCLGGDNSKTNLALLTAREHYIVHKCLAKIHEHDSKVYRKMIYALHRFIYSKNADYKITSREYENIKRLHRESVSTDLRGKRKSTEVRAKMSAA